MDEQEVCEEGRWWPVYDYDGEVVDAEYEPDVPWWSLSEPGWMGVVVPGRCDPAERIPYADVWPNGACAGRFLLKEQQ